MTEPSAPESGPAPEAEITLALILGALAFGAVLGVGLQALVTFSVDWLKAGAAPTGKPSLSSAHALTLLLGTPAGIALTGYTTWRILAPIRNPWRQAMLAIVAGLGSFVLSVLLIWPLHANFGRTALLGLAGVAAAGCLLIAVRLGALRATA